MNERILFSVTAVLLELMVMNGHVRANDDDVEKIIKCYRGKVVRGEKAEGKPIMSIDMSVGGITDEKLKPIGNLKNLTMLYLNGTRVTDEGLKHLANLKSLKTLNLNSTDVSGVGLRNLANLRALTNLSLSGTKITDTG